MPSVVAHNLPARNAIQARFRRKTFHENESRYYSCVCTYVRMEGRGRINVGCVLFSGNENYYGDDDDDVLFFGTIEICLLN